MKKRGFFNSRTQGILKLGLFLVFLLASGLIFNKANAQIVTSTIVANQGGGLRGKLELESVKYADGKANSGWNSPAVVKFKAAAYQYVDPNNPPRYEIYGRVLCSKVGQATGPWDAEFSRMVPLPYNDNVNPMGSSNYITTCNYNAPGTYKVYLDIYNPGGYDAWANYSMDVKINSGGSVSVTPTKTPPPTVPSLTAKLTGGTGGVTPYESRNTAYATSNAIGNYYYYFYCDRSDSGTGTSNPAPFEQALGIVQSSWTMTNLCSYTKPGTYTPKVIIKQKTQNSTLSAENRMSISVTQPPTTITPALVANPNPSDTSKTVTLTGKATTNNANDTINYSFWWNCASTTKSYSQAVTECGDPTNSTIGLKANNLSASTVTKSTTHKYSEAGTYTPKVLVEQGNASATTNISLKVDQAKELSSPTPTPTIQPSDTLSALITLSKQQIRAKEYVDIEGRIIDPSNKISDTSFYLWWDCNNPTTSVTEATASCGRLGEAFSKTLPAGIYFPASYTNKTSLSSSFDAGSQTLKLIAIRNGVSVETRLTINVLESLISPSPSVRPSPSKTATVKPSITPTPTATVTPYSLSVDLNVSPAEASPGNLVSLNAISTANYKVKGKYSYYFWWNCEIPQTTTIESRPEVGLEQLMTLCGNPSTTTIGKQIMGGASQPVDHIYTTPMQYKPLVAVQYGSLLSTAQAGINVVKPTLSAGLIVNPTTADGAAKPATLIASAGGTATGSLNYTFWWNCNESGTDLVSLAQKCGDPTSSLKGAKYTENTNPKIISHDYITPGTFYPKVVVERGFADPQEARSQITINEIPLPTLNVGLGATRTSADNVLPATVDITANVSGSASGQTEYKIWWDCQPNTQDFSKVQEICGDPSDASKGTTVLSGENETTKIISTSYSLAGLRHPFVLAQRQSIQSMAETEINIPDALPPDTLTAKLTVSPTSIKVGESAKLNVNTDSNNTKDSYNYYFWWNCPNADSLVLSDVIASCGDPSDSLVGKKYVGEANTISTKELTHKYGKTGRFYTRAFVEHGTVSANSFAEIVVSDISTNETPTPTVTPSVVPTPSPSIQPSPTPTPSATVSITAIPTVSIVPSPTPSMTPTPETLSVSLASGPDKGFNPLNDVTLTAKTSGTATGTLNYTFYCNRSDDGVDIKEGYVSKFDGINEAEKVLPKACSYEKAGTYTAKVIVERGSASPAQAKVAIQVDQSSGIKLKELVIKAYPEATQPKTAIQIKTSVVDVYGNVYDDNGHQEGSVKLDGLQIFLSLPDEKAGKLGSSASSTYLETSENLGTYPIEGSAIFEDQVLKQTANITITNEIPVLTSIQIKARESFLNQIIPGTNSFRVKPNGYLRLYATPLDQFGQWFANANMSYQLSSQAGALQPNGLIQAGPNEGTYSSAFKATATSLNKKVEATANIIVTSEIEDNGVCTGENCPVPTDPSCNPCPELSSKVCQEKPLVCVGNYCILPACKEPNCTSKSVCIGSYCLQTTCLSEVTAEDCPPDVSPTPTPSQTPIVKCSNMPPSPNCSRTGTDNKGCPIWTCPTPTVTATATADVEPTSTSTPVINSDLRIEIEPANPEIERSSEKQFVATIYSSDDKITDSRSVGATNAITDGYTWSSSNAGTINTDGLFTAGESTGDFENAVKVSATVSINGETYAISDSTKVKIRDKVCVGAECQICPNNECCIGDMCLPKVIGEVINAASPHNTKIPPIAGAVALAVLAVSAVAPIVANAGTISGLIGRSSNLFFFLPFGPRRKKNYGIVVDASTGNGVPGIIVDVINLSTGKEVLRSVTDRMGRFSILVPSGKYMLNIKAKDYEITDLPGFYKPKTTIEINQSAKSPVTPKIAILQSSKTLSKKLKVLSSLETLQRVVFPISTISLAWGTYLTILQIPQRTSSGNVVVFTLYAIVWGIWLASLLKRKIRNVGLVKSSNSPIERAVVRVFDTNNRLISTTVTDKDGKFSLMLPKGEYIIKTASSGYIQDKPVSAVVKEELGPISANIQLRKL